MTRNGDDFEAVLVVAPLCHRGKKGSSTSADVCSRAHNTDCEWPRGGLFFGTYYSKKELQLADKII